MARSILAVFTGYATTLAVFVAAYLVMLKWFPDDVPQPGSTPALPILSVVAVLCVCCGTLGGWVAAIIAGRRQFQHGIALGIVIVLLGLLKPLLAPEAEPLWSHLTLVIAAAIGSVLGGRISARRNSPVSQPNRAN
jgi:hypothetical protein